MTLADRWSRSGLAKALRSLGNGLAGATLLAATGALTAGCLDRPIAPATPNTTNVFVGQIRQTGVDKIDLLFMIDNSISMADKQEILAEAVPVLLRRLITPVCIDPQGNSQQQGPNGCPMGTSLEFKPVENIHIGIVTSSLGHHGSKDVCSDASEGRTPDDKANLLPFVRTGLTSWDNQGFLVWDPRGNGNDVDGPHDPLAWGSSAQLGGADELIAAFTDHVEAAGELGCGYEQQLESWYRFLIDPEPVDVMDNDGTNSTRIGVNQAVLQQRAKFLRRDSLLAIIMLTDENDCSIVDENGSQGWLVGYKGGPMVNTWRMPAATASCREPNNPCCRPCISPAANGCPSNEAEGCTTSGYLALADDSMNQRCYNQVQRFGINLLYPIQRYVEALKSPTIYPRMDGVAQPNPLFAPGPNGELARDAGLVFLAGIVGVPWQDIATDSTSVAEGKPDSLRPGSREIAYLTADELQAKGRWAMILGDPPTGVPPTDPLMIESIDPRPTGATHPLLPGVAIATGGRMNPINGHEQVVEPTKRDDLQFACTFELRTPVDCSAANAAGCDCNADEYVKNSPLCQYSSPMADGTQVYAKAYPGVRELEVLRGIGPNAIVASICPKNPVPMGGSPASDPFYGYNPAVAAIVDRLKEALSVKCLPRPLVPELNPDSPDVGKVPCAVVEVRPQVKLPDNSLVPCNACNNGTGRFELEGEKRKVIPAVQEYLENNGQCGTGAGLPSCSQFCMCEIQQFTDANLTECQTNSTAAGLFGYCYVDPAAAAAAGRPDAEVRAQEALVEPCPATQKRILRFLGDNLPAKDGLAFIACIGAAASQVTPAM